ncbi:MAG: hypothetical protein IKE46_11300, partial [Selenomonadaceae bacterium]|nr:hypothetical protein [Selenomonadaceae bacterium]
GLQMFKEYPDEYTQEFIDERENLYDSLSRKYRKLVGELESLQKTPPEPPAPESAETHAEPEEITFIAQNGASLTIEGGMPTIAANGNRLEVNGIWLGDYYTNEDAQEAAEALKIDVEEFGNDHSVLSKDYFAEIENAAQITESEPETQKTLRGKAAKLGDLKERLDKEKSFAECARDKLEIAQTWMRAASKNSYSAEFYAEQIATTSAAVKKLKERIAKLAEQITAVETELETVNKKITGSKKAA